jgi:long-subunit fatty acid transport protein
MRRLFIVVLSLLALAGRAQSNSEVNAGLQFNFLSPGARSLGLGGAFAAIADDATAAYANPAGLVNIIRPEASAELRMWQFTGFYPSRGHGFGTPTNRGVDTIEGIETGKAHAMTEGLSFASFVYPRRRWAFGFYRHEVANFETTQVNEGIFFNNPDNRGSIFRFFPTKSELSLHISSFGGAAGYRVNDSLSLGLAVARYGMSLSSSSVHYEYNSFAAPAFEQPHNSERQSGDAHNIAIVGGVLWDVRERLTLAAVYRQGPRFPITISSEPGPPPGSKGGPCKGTFRVPDIVGVGASYRLSSRVTFSTDINRVQYSDLMSGFHVFDVNDQCVLQGPDQKYVLRDGTEMHLGSQWVMASDSGFFSTHPVILIAGYWIDPPHSIENRDLEDPQRLLFGRGRSDRHYSVGFSLLASAKQQISVGFDMSRRQRTLSISALSRMP